MDRSMIAPAIVKDRAGKLKLALLVWIAVLGVIGYYGFQIGGAYWKRYKLEEAVRQELSSAGQLADAGIRQRVLEYAAGMNPPLPSRAVRFGNDGPRTLRVSISYADTVNFVFTQLELPMSVEVRRSY